MKKRDLIAPITSLCFVRDVLLSGEGSYLCVYDVYNGVQLSSRHVFGNSRIHGIRVDSKDGLLAVFGQTCIRIVKISNLDNQARIHIVSDIISLPDIILDAHWLHKESETCHHITIATAHNAVWCIDYQTSKSWLVAQCEENSILYSAKFFGENLNSLLLAAGTVFNQILLWKVKGIQNEDSTTKILHKLIGHEGVIFQINFNDSGTLLVSVSDDRSIRLWKLVISECGVPQDIECLHVMYGHSARVWDAQLLQDCIVSVGEDAVCNIWNYEGILLKKFTGHLGKSIWSLAINEDKNIIATGGGDASIRLFSLDDVHDQETMATVAAFLPGTQGKVTKKGGIAMDTPRSVFLENDGKLLVMTSEGCLYEYFWREEMANQDTNQSENNVLNEEEPKDKRERDHQSGWKLLLQDSNYSSYSLMAVSPDRKFVAFGNLKGNVKVHDTDFSFQSTEVQPFTSKVLNLLWSQHKSSHNLFTCGPEGIIIWWLVYADEKQKINLQQLRTFCIPYSKQRWASAVEVITSSDDHLGDYHVVFGDRKGSIHLFDARGASEDKILRPSQTLPILHGAIGVTQLCSHDGKLYSAGRDGTYRQYKVCHSRLELIDTKKVFKGFDWVERLVFTANGGIVVTGFHTAFFVVWSIDKNEALFKVKCGGGHRAWDFSLHQLQESRGHEVVFTYLKGNCVYTHTARLKNAIPKPVLKPSFHGRETTCMAYVCDLPSRDHETPNYHLFMTGSEDTTINVMLYDSHSGRANKIFTAQGHISSVRALSVTKCPPNTPQLTHQKTPNLAPRHTTSPQTPHGTECRGSVEIDPSDGLPRGTECTTLSKYLLFSGGGRASLRCWRIDPTAVHTSGGCNTTFSPVSFLAEYSSRSSNHKRRRRRREGHLHSEIRFMSLSSFPLHDVAMDDDDVLGDVSHGCYGVAAACSDGFVRIFVFDEKECKFFLLCQSEYLLRCVLSVRHVVHEDSSGHRAVIVFAGDTAGKITIWDITQHVIQYLREEADAIGKDVAMETKSPMSIVTVAMETNSSTVAMETKSSTVAMETKSSVAMETVAVVANSSVAMETVAVVANSSVAMKTVVTQENFHVAIDTVGVATGDSSTYDSYLLTKRISSSSTENCAQEFSCISLVNNSLGQPLHVFTAHQSGVNDMSIHKGSSSYVLCSGGDDSAIFVAEFLVLSPESGSRVVHVTRQETIQSAHTSSVTGVRLLDESTMISSSTDQRLKFWNINQASKQDERSTKLDHVIFVDVPDVQAIETWKTGVLPVVAVCGVGLQIIQ